MMVDQNNPHNIDGHNKENLYKYNSFPENEQTSVSWTTFVILLGRKTSLLNIWPLIIHTSLVPHKLVAANQYNINKNSLFVYNTCLESNTGL